VGEWMGVGFSVCCLVNGEVVWYGVWAWLGGCAGVADVLVGILVGRCGF